MTFQAGELPPGQAFSIRSDGRRVRVTAADAAGAAQAASTLFRRAQLAGKTVEWPAFELADGPDCSYRSFMVDMGRNPHSPEVLHQVVDMLWFYRANLLHLHLTDDQLISWPSQAFPKLQSKGAGWTREDFVALETYASARGVAIVPEIGGQWSGGGPAWGRVPTRSMRTSCRSTGGRSPSRRRRCWTPGTRW